MSAMLIYEEGLELQPVVSRLMCCQAPKLAGEHSLSVTASQLPEMPAGFYGMLAHQVMGSYAFHGRNESRTQLKDTEPVENKPQCKKGTLHMLRDTLYLSQTRMKLQQWKTRDSIYRFSPFSQNIPVILRVGLGSLNTVDLISKLTNFVVFHKIWNPHWSMYAGFTDTFSL